MVVLLQVQGPTPPNKGLTPNKVFHKKSINISCEHCWDPHYTLCYLIQLPPCLPTLAPGLGESDIAQPSRHTNPS